MAKAREGGGGSAAKSGKCEFGKGTQIVKTQNDSRFLRTGESSASLSHKIPVPGKWILTVREYRFVNMDMDSQNLSYKSVFPNTDS